MATILPVQPSGTLPPIAAPDFEKAGDTILPWKRKWGVADSTKTPKARLWWLTDPEMKGEDWRVDALSSNGKFGLISQQDFGSPFPIGDRHTVGGPEHLRVLTPPASATSIGMFMLGGDYVPSVAGVPTNIEAQIDIKSLRHCRVALLVTNGQSTYVSKYISVQRGDTWVRRTLDSPLSSAIHVGGLQKNPTTSGAPFQFGLHITAITSGVLGEVRLDNFEVRVAAACSAGKKAAEVPMQRERAEREADLRKTLDKLTFGDSISGVSTKEYSADVIKQELLTDGDVVANTIDLKTELQGCCNDEEVIYTSDGSIAAPEGANDDTEAIAHFVDEEVDLSSVVTADTSTDAWMQSFPCKKSIGDYVPTELAALEARVLDGEPMPTVMEGQGELPRRWEEQEASDAAADAEDILSSLNTKLAPSPTLNPDGSLGLPDRASWAPSAADKYAFEGYDICYVHGLKLSHLYDGLLQRKDLVLKKKALTSWITPKNATATDILKNNQEYFNNGYFSLNAKLTWLGDGSKSLAQLPSVVQQNLASAVLPLNALPPGASTFLPLGGTPVDGHVGRFLLGNGFRNRFMIACFNCNDRIDKAISAVLTQISLAMSHGIGVYNPSTSGSPDVLWMPATNDVVPPSANGFGARGLVIVSHSAGGLVVDLALTKALKNSALGVGYIPLNTKAHIATQAALGGSGLATYAWCAASFTGSTFRWALKNVFRDVAQQAEIADLGSQTDLAKPIMGTILKDLRPGIVAVRYRHVIRQTPVRTLLIEGGHPTSLFDAKVLFHAGFDDNTVCANSAGASRAFPWFWPHGSLTPMPALNFDLGLFGPKVTLPTIKIGGGKLLQLQIKIGANYLAQPMRALGYYIDQRVDPLVRICLRRWEPRALRPLFQATFVSPFLSPSGMLMTGVPMVGTPHDPYWRSKNHFRFLASAADHFEGTHDQGMASNPDPDIEQPNYQSSPDSQNNDLKQFLQSLIPGEKPVKLETNREECYVVNNLTIYTPFNPAGLSLRPAYWPVNMWDVPLLHAKYFPLRFRTRGCYIEFTLRIGKKLRLSKTIWFFRRHYVLLKGWEEMMQFDYVYGRDGLGGVLRKS
jgi:hypothetical protein